MKEMNREQRDRWEKIRAKGKIRFVALQILVYGLIPIVSSPLWYSLKFLWTGNAEFNSIDYGERVFVAFCFALLGYFQAERQWRSQEQQYKTSAMPYEIT